MEEGRQDRSESPLSRKIDTEAPTVPRREKQMVKEGEEAPPPPKKSQIPVTHDDVQEEKVKRAGASLS